jgi:predicted transcriptional regulator
MRKNRDKLCLVAAILEATNTGGTKTSIMYHANLSFKLLEKYLATANNASLIYKDGSTYRLTEQGIHFLRKYAHFRNRYFRTQKTLKDLAAEREILEKICQQNNGAPLSKST